MYFKFNDDTVEMCFTDQDIEVIKEKKKLVTFFDENAEYLCDGFAEITIRLKMKVEENKKKKKDKT